MQHMRGVEGKKEVVSRQQRVWQAHAGSEGARACHTRQEAACVVRENGSSVKSSRQREA